MKIRIFIINISQYFIYKIIINNDMALKQSGKPPSYFFKPNVFFYSENPIYSYIRSSCTHNSLCRMNVATTFVAMILLARIVLNS